MNSAKIVAAALLAALAVPAFANTVSGQAATTTQRVPAASKDGVPGGAASTWTAQSGTQTYAQPYGQPTHEMTRAQVYGELVHAEQDGQLKYLNSTLYAH
ncbi:DUF4148 domain-containing protein [Burkholderia sp. 3C]